MTSSAVTASLECAISYNEDEACTSWVALIPCGHLYHPTCIDKWIASQAQPNRPVIHWSCPICRHAMPFRKETLTPSERTNLAKSYVQVKLDTDAPTSTQGDAESDVKVKILEMELREEKEEKEHWMKVYEIAEATHTELLEFKTEDYRKQLERLQLEVDSLKEKLRIAQGSDGKETTLPSRQRRTIRVLEAERKDEGREIKKQKPSSTVLPLPPSRVPLVTPKCKTPRPSSSPPPLSVPVVPMSELEAPGSFDFNTLQGLPPTSTFRAKGKGKAYDYPMKPRILSEDRRASARLAKKEAGSAPINWNTMDTMEMSGETKGVISCLLQQWKKETMRAAEDPDEEEEEL